jgi:Flp pilus assembly protein TadG
MTTFRRLLRSERAASAAEFALVLPLLLILLFGIIDVGRFLWQFNQAEKATQMGVRYAVVTNPIPSGLSSYSFAISGGISQGAAVPTANFTGATCNNSSCACVATTGNFCSSVGYDATAFANLVARMKMMYPTLTASNVQVEYRNVGLGFAGDPNGPDVSPLVTVKVQSLTFRPLTCLVFACSISMPDFRAALTLEDASGSVSN